jgi:hypothetical protein
LSCRDRTGCSVRDLRRRRGSPGGSGGVMGYSMESGEGSPCYAADACSFQWQCEPG